MVAELGAQRVVIHSDSQLVVQQVKEEYEAKDERMMAYLQRVAGLRDKLSSFEVIQIPREENGKADSLSKLASSIALEGGGKVTIVTIEEESITPSVGLLE